MLYFHTKSIEILNRQIRNCHLVLLQSREGNGTPLQYSCLENPMDGGAWWAAVHGVAKSRTQLSDFTFTFHFHALEKEMATHSSILAWRIPGTEEPSGLPSMGSHRVGHDWSDLAAAAAVAYPTLCDPIAYRLQSFSVHGILQAGILEWAAIPFSRGSSLPRDRAQVSCVSTTCWPLHLSQLVLLRFPRQCGRIRNTESSK